MKKVNFVSRSCDLLEIIIMATAVISFVFWIAGIILFFISKDVCKVFFLDFIVIYSIEYILLFIWSYISKLDKKLMADYVLRDFLDMIKKQGIKGTAKVIVEYNYWFYLKFYTNDLNKVNFKKFSKEVQEKLNNIKNPRFFLECEEVKSI